LVIPLHVHTDQTFIPERLKKDGFNNEQIAFRMKRSDITWKAYLENSDSNIKIIINNSNKENFHRKINSLFKEYSFMKIDTPDVLYVNPSLKFALIKPLVGFKDDIVRKLEKYPYEKNIF
jgi:hypothetical protein